MSSVKIIRMAQGKNTTLSHLFIQGVFKCYLLEDTIREQKVYGSTCIPSGIYPLKLNIDAGMNKKYRSRYPSVHEGMIEITDIKDFTLVFIHIGNTHLDTKGCPLTGEYWEFIGGDYRVFRSALAYEAIYPEILHLIKKGSLNIEVINLLTD